LHVAEWLAPGSVVDLGGRRLEVLHTPGHTYDSTSLFDRESEQLFVGDFVTEGPVFAFLPGSSLGDYVRTAEQLLELTTESTRLLTAHRLDGPGLPELTRRDLVDLRDALAAIRVGELDATGFFPREYPINERLWLATDFAWAHDWQ
jgi:glyoxylase-like metal-dependent hydrolase (beta-lactamase superfamily II)